MSTLREVADSHGTSRTLSSLTPTLILAKAKVEGSFSSLLCSLGVCCRGELYPSIYIGSKVVLGAILGARTDLHHLSMEACHRLSKERQGGADRGLPAPRD